MDLGRIKTIESKMLHPAPPAWKVILLCLLGALFLGDVQAQGPTDRIEDVLIVGNRRIRESTIFYYIQTQKNGPYNESQILRDYRSLLNTNFFDDITVKRRQGDTGVVVVFEVQERPLVRAIEYEGMKSFKESDVLEKFRDMRVGLTVDSPFDPSKLPKARRAIRFLLDENGKPLGRVEMDVEEITSSSVRLLFKVEEGPKVRIGKIGFEGNTILGAKDLRSALELNKVRGPVTLFKGTDKYIKEKLEYDIHVNMLEKYRAIGYIQAKAGDAKVEIVEASRGPLIGLRKTKQQYFITIPIEEGEEHYYGDFSVEGAENFNAQALELLYGVRKGEVLNYVSLKKSNEDLKKLYSTRGYLDMEAIPQIEVQDDRTVNITINIVEGKQYIVDQIEFAGNTRTRDKVLRREMFIEEQQPFNGTFLDHSIIRLNQLGFFEPIQEEDYEVVKKPDEGSADVVVKVKERSQQSIGVNGGVSGISGTFFGINYTTNNFRGLGQQISVQLTTGTRTSNYLLRFTDPYFRGTKMSLSASIFNQRFRFDTFSASFGLINPKDSVELFTRAQNGFEVAGSYPWGRWSRLGLGYTLSNIRITDIDPTIEALALNQLIGFTPGGDPETARDGIIRSEIKPSWVRNTKNAFFNATAGSSLTVAIPIAGGPLGGTFNMISPFVEYQKFYSDRFLSRGRNTFAFRLQGRHVWPFGNLDNGAPQTVPFFERIFSGGEYTLRGFDIRSVSPLAITRVARTDSAGNPLIDPGSGLPSFSDSLIPVGGDTSVIGTAEYRVPIVGPLTLNGFVDVGTSTVLRKGNLNLFGPDTAVQLLANTNGVLRASTGVELQFLLPVVNQPFRLIFAYNPLVLNTDIVVQGRRFNLEEERSNVKFTVGYTF